MWKALCRPQEVWAKFLGHMTACQLFSIASLQFVFCTGFCHIFSAVSALTDSGQKTASCCRSDSECERAECKVQASSLLPCLFVLLSVALKSFTK